MRIINNVVIASNGSKLKYVDVRELSQQYITIFLIFSYMSKIINKNLQPFAPDEVIIVPCSLITLSYKTSPEFCTPIAISYNPDILVSDVKNGIANVMRIEDVLINEFGQEVYDSLIQITEEEFYDLTAPTE